jgi:hypothetical protein
MTKKELLKEMTGTITDIIKEVSEYNDDINEVQDDVNHEIFCMIGDRVYTIDTHKAKEISDTIGLYDAGDTSDITGERLNDLSQIAFENLYAFIYNEIDVAEMIETILKNK